MPILSTGCPGHCQWNVAMCTSQKYKMYLQPLVGAKASRCTLGFSEPRLEVGVYSQTKMMLSRNKTLDQARTKGTAGKLTMVAREVSKRQF